MILTLAATIAAPLNTLPPPPPPVDPVAAEILRMGIESATEIAFAIGADGAASDCVIEKSSGSDKLDAEACRILISRGKWAPQAKASGTAAPRIFRTRVVWRIED